MNFKLFAIVTLCVFNSSVLMATETKEACYGLYPSQEIKGSPNDLLCVKTWERIPPMPTNELLPPGASVRICTLDYVMTLSASTVILMDSLSEIEEVKINNGEKNVVRKYVIPTNNPDLSAFYSPIQISGVTDSKGNERGVASVNGRQLFYEKQDWSKFLVNTNCK